MLNEETQTIARLAQSRNSLATKPEVKDVHAFASLWDMQDTYAKIRQKVEKEEEDEMVMYQEPHPSLLRKKNQKFVEHRLKTFEDITTLPRFYDAAVLVERVLASKEYSKQQKKNIAD
ncbi:hypothetical protein EVAR_26021_1 [Eumeta japonica]|uniref:Uncharacterized protein n=1 Tax=Eumeta variegata TaxID=151549 RepID=A0A4C1VQL3_EUMVA|nr:hypothetical protein EVAR_26021_1 [Eumeta japonica]